LFATLASALFSGCFPARKLEEGQVFLRKNKTAFYQKVVADKGTYSREEAEAVIRPKANRKILGTFRFNLWAYNRVNRDKMEAGLRKKNVKFERKREVAKAKGKKRKDKEVRTFRSWMANTVGEPPTLFDSLVMAKSASQISLVLSKNGYFNNEVEPVVKYNKRGNRAKVTYHVKPRSPHRLVSITHTFPDAGMEGMREFLTKDCLLKPEDQFNVANINSERDRITTLLNNNGYFEFSKEYIRSKVDTSTVKTLANISLEINRPAAFIGNEKDSLHTASHRTFSLQNIFIYTNYPPLSRGYTPHDTLRYKGAHILYDKDQVLRPDLLYYTLFIQPGDVYDRSDADLTYRRFSRLGVFKSVNMRFDEVSSSEKNLLDCHIMLSPAESRNLKLQTNATHRVGNLGLSGNVSFQHRNLFRGAERFEARINAGFEAQQLLIDQSQTGQIGNEIERQFRLNTFEIGPEIILSIPRFVPFSLERFSRSNNPNTEFHAALNYQLRPDYRRTLNKVGFSYRYNETSTKTHIISPAEISLIKITKSDAFEQQLLAINDQFLLNSYRDHFITAGSYTFIFNNKAPRRQARYYFSSSTVELAGNLMRSAYRTFNRPTNESGNFEALGIQFAQYARFEQDFRYYRVFNELRQLVFRLSGGLGKPLNNLSVLPFEKSFISGGSVGVRAWKARTLGPGSYRDPNYAVTFNNIGEIKLEANLEYRFSLTKMLKGAWFIDAGNIWLFNEDELRPGSAFNKETFLSEIAIGAGLGARLDFDFFIFRFDLGMQLKDPQKVPGERWIGQPKGEYNEYLKQITPAGQDPQRYLPEVSLHLGIGYPF